MLMMWLQKHVTRRAQHPMPICKRPRLIFEWLDIGAQYHNDPFAVPDN